LSNADKGAVGFILAQELAILTAIEGYFVGLPQNKKGYIVSNSWNPLRVYVSYDVIFVETPETSR